LWADSRILASAANKMDRGWTTLNLYVSSNLKNCEVDLANEVDWNWTLDGLRLGSKIQETTGATLP
jgi:hypothetical protein